MNQGWQSESTDGPKGAWDLLSFSLFLWLSTHLPTYLLCIYLSIYLSLSLFHLITYLSTTACTFSTSQLPKVVRTWCVLYILTWKCASRHNGVQFFISHLASWLRTRRFSEPTFRLSGATNHWENTVFRDFPTFSRICIFCLLTLSLLLFSLLIFLFSLPLPYSAFHLSILSGGLTSKLPLPSIMVIPFNTFMAPIASP